MRLFKKWNKEKHDNKELPPLPKMSELDKLRQEGKILDTEEKQEKPKEEKKEDKDKEKEKIEITPEYMVDLINSNYLALAEVYKGLILRFDLLNSKLSAMEDVINDTWKTVHNMKNVIDMATKEEGEKKK